MLLQKPSLFFVTLHDFINELIPTITPLRNGVGESASSFLCDVVGCNVGYDVSCLEVVCVVCGIEDIGVIIHIHQVQSDGRRERVNDITHTRVFADRFNVLLIVRNELVLTV